MTDELFTTEETLSPRLRWMREHGVSLWHDASALVRPWVADHRDESDMGTLYAYGDTEDEALVNLAKKLGIKLWNEQ